jgi:predicted RND superfamily exporter protein
LERIAAGPPALRARLQDAATAGLPTALQQVRALLTAHEVSLATLPAEVKRDWIAPDGQARVQVTPAARYADPARLPDFVRAVSRVAPGAVGPSVARIEVQRLILGAFAQAALLALAAIVALLLVTLRRWSDVALTLAPVLLSGMLTAATCVLLGQDINLENLIALPLLLGVGVSFSIYFVVAWRGGARRLLASSLARAILFSAATTGAAFGALALSQHPGTASLGILLLISLFWTLVTTLVVLPALLSVVRPASAPSAR